MPDVLRTINYKQLTINRKSKGFTLIELLIVISIIAILIVIVVASFGGAQDKARDARRKEDLDAVKKSLELAKSDCKGSAWYPVMTGLTGDARYDVLEAYLDDADLHYMRNVPVDPGLTGVNDYWYTTSGTSQTNVCLTIATPPAQTQTGQNIFLLRALLENMLDPTGADSITKCAFAGAVAVAGQNPYYVCND